MEQSLRVLVTGGHGFIGTHVVTALLSAGHEVRVLDNFHPAAHNVRPPGHPDIGDVRDKETVASALDGIDVVVHQAAMVGLGTDLNDLPDYVSTNDLGTAVLLATMAAKGTRKLVLASSMVVYGEGSYTCEGHGAVRPQPRRQEDLDAGIFDQRCPYCGAGLSAGRVDEDSYLEPRSVYASTKLAQENLTSAWAHATGGCAIALRYHNVYGPGMPRNTPYSGVAAIFRSALERGNPPQVFEDGHQLRDFIHVADISAANLAAVRFAAAERSTRFRAYNVASGHPHTIGEMAKHLSASFGGPHPVVTGAFRAGDVRQIVASPMRATSELGFQAARGFEDGMREFAHAPLRD